MKRKPFSKKGTSGELIQRMLLRKNPPSTEAILKAVANHFREIGIDCKTGRNDEFRERILDLLKLHAAAFCDLDR